MAKDFENMKLDFSDLDQVECNLITLAHTLAMDKEQFVATMGRFLKTLAPAWVAFIKAEQDRNEPNGPGVSVTASLKSYAFLSYILIRATAKSDVAFDECTDKIITLFSSFLNDFAGTPKPMENLHDPVWSETVH